MRAQLFWERLYKQTCLGSVRQSLDEVVGSRSSLVKWELSNAKGFCKRLTGDKSVTELVLHKTFYCSWITKSGLFSNS